MRERPVYEFFRKILLTYGVSFGKMLTPGSIRKGNMAGDPKRTDKEDKQESMRSKLNRFIALLLCVLLTAGAVIPVRASSLPEIGPGSVTTVAEGESTEEITTSAETSEEDTQTEEPSVTEPEEQPTEPEETEPEAPELPKGMTVEEYLAIKRTVMNNSSVDVYAENSTAPAEIEDIESGVLLAKRLKKLAQNSEFNAVIFRGSSYVRVRAKADLSADIIGKMYYNAVATILGTEYSESGMWYHIRSGKIEGYVKSAYMVSGSEAMDLLTEIVSTWVTPINDAQRLYEWANTNSDTMALLTSGVKYKVQEIGDTFIKVFYGTTATGENVSGYVPRNSVRISYEMQTAITIADENLSVANATQAKVAANSRAQSRAESSRQASIEASIRESSYLAYLASSRARAAYESSLAASRWAAQQSQAAAQSSMQNAAMAANQRNYAQYIPEGTSELRRAIVLDAVSYVAILPYVWGGESLVYGADCSGFIRAIFLKHGIQLPHYSKQQAVFGVRVPSLSQARPGDIVSYHCGPNDGTGHVGIYIGNGLVVHAPKPGEKVKVNAADFMTIWSIQNVIGD